MILPCTVSKISACKGKKMSLQWTNLADAIRTKLSRGTQDLKKGGVSYLAYTKKQWSSKNTGKNSALLQNISTGTYRNICIKHRYRTEDGVDCKALG